MDEDDEEEEDEAEEGYEEALRDEQLAGRYEEGPSARDIESQRRMQDKIWE